jgi:hypothetical protein
MNLRLTCAGLVLFSITVVVGGEDAPDLAKNETAAAAACKALAEAQEIYRRTDYDMDGVLEYSQCIHGGGRRLDLPAAVVAKLPKPTEEEQKKVAELIGAMSSDEFAVREKAFKDLAALGAKALEQLQTAAKDTKDAEIANRCKRLVKDVQDALAPKPQYDNVYGLYIAGDQERRLVDKSFAEAECPLGGDPQKATPRNGYLFRALHSQGANAVGKPRNYLVNGNQTLGYAMLAFPKEYGRTGRKCFMISNNGTIYEKDLGDQAKTDEFVKKCDEFDPDKSWTVTE